MALYEHLDRFEDAARLTLEQPVYGVRIDGAALLEAYHSGGPDAYWRKRIEILDGALVEAPRAIHYGYAVLYTRLGDSTRAIDHLQRLVDAHSSNAVFIGVDPCLQPLHGDARFHRVLSRLGVPTASAPHTASP
jgi:hypothetical protein